MVRIVTSTFLLLWMLSSFNNRIEAGYFWYQYHKNIQENTPYRPPRPDSPTTRMDWFRYEGSETQDDPSQSLSSPYKQDLQRARKQIDKLQKTKERLQQRKDAIAGSGPVVQASQQEIERELSQITAEKREWQTYEQELQQWIDQRQQELQEHFEGPAGQFEEE